MDFQNQYEFALPIAEMPDDQPPAPSYPEKPQETGPLNPTPDVPGTDAPGVNTGSRIDADEQAERKDEDEVGEIESQNP
jgi:hypothetical protein